MGLGAILVREVVEILAGPASIDPAGVVVLDGVDADSAGLLLGADLD